MFVAWHAPFYSTLCVLQNVQGADIRYNYEKSLGTSYVYPHALFENKNKKKQSTYYNIASVHLAMRPPIRNAVSS